MVFSGKTFNKFRYELFFIGLSLLVIVGIGLLPQSPPSSVAPSATAATVAPTP